ncbi:DUF1427 family protein [bacterium]|nr:DUF1427 family protein [bacterium]
MKLYFLSLGAGLVAGILYSLLHVRSPAPPMVALVGLLGILMGEQIIPVGRQLLSGTSPLSASERSRAIDHLFGQLPGHHGAPGNTITGLNGTGTKDRGEEAS